MNIARNNIGGSATDSEQRSASEAIHIDITPQIQQQEQQSLLPNQQNSTSINMDANSPSSLPPRRSMHSNLLTFFQEARSQFARQTDSTSHVRNTFVSNLNDSSGSAANVNLTTQEQRQPDISAELPNTSNSGNPQYSRLRTSLPWRVNLNDVLSFSSSPSSLRSLITNSSGLRYIPLSTGDNNDNASNQRISNTLNAGLQDIAPEFRLNTRVNRTIAMHQNSNNSVHSSQNQQSNANGFVYAANGTPESNPRDINATEQIDHLNGIEIPRRHSNDHFNHNSGNADFEDENNVISEVFVKVLSHFLRYLPFICILFVKFIHDHSLGILDIALLHGIMFQMNKSVREQISKLSQKNYSILFRNFTFIALVVAYRFILNGASAGPFGMIIAPRSSSVTIEVPSLSIVDSPASEYAENREITNNENHAKMVTFDKPISLGILIYYVAVNDLILKLITILIKVLITLMPTKLIRHKPRARTYVVVEHLSQTYRALAPVHQWLIFLIGSYTGLEVISGILFAAFYMGAKGCEIYERGNHLKKAIMNLLRNMDYERKPTKEELAAVDILCPICHDSYTNPIVLECSHIFCDDCVSTWFKREQTCPMCRARISEDPTWQDGSTTFFYQLC